MAQAAETGPAPNVFSDEYISIRYVEQFPVRVTGLATGRGYEFSSTQPVQSVDAGDAASLLNTGHFTRD